MAPDLRPDAPAPLRGVRAVVFDAYGTLFDVASAAERAKDALGPRWRPVAELWRAKQLQYTWLRSLMGRHADFWRVTGDALDFALASVEVDDRELRARLLSLYDERATISLSNTNTGGFRVRVSLPWHQVLTESPLLRHAPPAESVHV